jgi:nitrate/TMAO reductase-like tetraheme cytochrome c subunit
MKLSKHAFAFVMSRRAFILLVILILALLGGAGGIAFTCRPQFCSYCHEMDQDYRSWQSSTHRNVNCISCHVEPGLYNLVKDKMTTGVKSLVLKITGNYETPINEDGSVSEEIQNDVCDQCHTVVEKSTTFRGVIMNHGAHLKTKLTCATCHNRIAHEIKGYKSRLTEEFCLECHNGRALSNECSVCHTPEFLKQNKGKTRK